MEISDNRETIKRASEASGAKKMLEDLANKMRAEKQGLGQTAEKQGLGQTQGRPQSIDDFYVKSSAEIPGAINKIIDALMKYAEKVKQKRMYYGQHDKKWFPFDEKDKDKEYGEIEKIKHSIQRLQDNPPKDVATFNELVTYVYKNKIMGGIEG
jgi:hypothetical protein